MRQFSFLGETPTIALKKAQEECGDDAVLISTKKISSKSKNSVNQYEVIVALEDDYDNHKDDPSENIIISSSPTDTINNNNENMQFSDFKNQIEKMQKSIEQVQKTVWEPKSQLYDLSIPPEFIEIYQLFEDNDFDPEMTYSILKKTIEQLPVTMRSNPQKINNFFKLILRRIVAIRHEIPLRVHQKKVMMLVGPTGVGKTTTIAKLAARYAYKLGITYKVGIITLDSFRVGAIEQLKAYANIMRLPLEIVKKSEDLVEALLRLQDCHYILIDTAGSSQYDIDKIELINEYQRKLTDDIIIEKILVMPANIKTTDLQEIFYHYAMLGIDNISFTKLDETKSFGNLITFTHKSKKSISYLSIGQNVPDDLIVADSSFVIDCFMNRFCSKI